VLSNGRDMVWLGYSRLSGDATRIVDRGGESGNPNRVDWVHRGYDTNWRIDQATQDSRGNWDGGSGQ
jgi:hypothetical protein